MATIGKFTVLGPLGTGAHSTILRVRRVSDGREYALKVVPIGDEEDQKFLEQARLEYRVGQMLDHPALVKVFCLDEERSWLFKVKKASLLIEYVAGKPLDEVPALNPTRAVGVFAQVASGLAHMHRRGVFHADLKPNNIMLAPGDRVKVIDYGLAWVKGEPKDRVQGTPEYMAPETIKNKVVDERTEVFNLGATMYRILCLRNTPNLFEMAESARVSAKTFRGMFKPVRECNAAVPPELAALVERCLEFSPDKRPESMPAVAEELEQLREQLGEGD